jgi:hypothetical protein
MFKLAACFVPVSVERCKYNLSFHYFGCITTEIQIFYVIPAIKPILWLLRPVVNIFELALPFYTGKKIPKAYDMAVEVKNEYFNNSRPLLLQYIDVSVKPHIVPSVSTGVRVRVGPLILHVLLIESIQ